MPRLRDVEHAWASAEDAAVDRHGADNTEIAAALDAPQTDHR